MTQEEKDGRKLDRELILTFVDNFCKTHDTEDVLYIESFNYMKEGEISSYILNTFRKRKIDGYKVVKNSEYVQIVNAVGKSWEDTLSSVKSDDDPDIFRRITYGLKDDYTEVNGHVWKVKDYLRGKTKGVQVWIGNKYLGTAYPSIHDAPRIDFK